MFDTRYDTIREELVTLCHEKGWGDGMIELIFSEAQRNGFCPDSLLLTVSQMDVHDDPSEVFSSGTDCREYSEGFPGLLYSLPPATDKKQD